MKPEKSLEIREYRYGVYFVGDKNYCESLNAVLDVVREFFGGEESEKLLCYMLCPHGPHRVADFRCQREDGHGARHACSQHGLWGDEQKPEKCRAGYETLEPSRHRWIQCSKPEGHKWPHSGGAVEW